MNLRLESIELPLAQFTLAVDATLTGRVTALFGSSGAGKTTLLEIIAGLRQPARGVITLDGEVLVDIGSARGHTNVPPHRRAVGYLPQEAALFPHLTVRQNLLYGTHARFPDNGANLTYEHVTGVLEIAALAERAVGTLSGGEKQRVALGRAILSHPRLLLLDEPLAGLDHAMKQRLIPYFTKIREEFQLPLIYVTHSPDEVIALCDDVLVLDQGKLVNQGTPATLFTRDSMPHYKLCNIENGV